jgi:hypothetical protein
MSINIMVKIKHISRVYRLVARPGHSSYKIAPQNRGFCSAVHELPVLRSGRACPLSLGLFLKIFPNFAIMGQRIAVPANDPCLQTYAGIAPLCPPNRGFIFDIILLYNIGTTPRKGAWERPQMRELGGASGQM